MTGRLSYLSHRPFPTFHTGRKKRRSIVLFGKRTIAECYKTQIQSAGVNCCITNQIHCLAKNNPGFNYANRYSFWIINAWVNILQLATSYSTLTDAISSFSSWTTMSKDTSCSYWKDVSLYWEGSSRENI